MSSHVPFPVGCTIHDLPSHLPDLRRYALRLIRCRVRADDLVQDTAERALRYAHSFTPGTDLRKWLLAIMHNVFLSEVRRAGRLPCSSLDDMSYSDSTALGSAESRWAELYDLRHALQHLPGDQRDVILMIGIECMTYEGVAAHLEIPVGTVMSRLSRGRRRLRQLLSGDRSDLEDC
ncbi:RNA polymerase sigma factor [Paraburkholderia sp. 2C]